jgi:hypothetical protein
MHGPYCKVQVQYSTDLEIQELDAPAELPGQEARQDAVAVQKPVVRVDDVDSVDLLDAIDLCKGWKSADWSSCDDHNSPQRKDTMTPDHPG